MGLIQDYDLVTFYTWQSKPKSDLRLGKSESKSWQVKNRSKKR